MPKLIDLTGKVSGKLAIIERDTATSSTKAKWICQCECGNIVFVVGCHLRNGHTKSCGCLQKEKAAKLMKNIIQPLGTKAKENDLVGKQFGILTVIEQITENKGDKKQWKCLCSCGNYKIVTGSDLVTGHVSSCGCIRVSAGEAIIEDILKKNQIPFVREKSFEDCVFKQRLRFDFYVADKYLIEFDGKQHFETANKFWDTEDYLREIQLRDSIKNEYCRQNNLILIRIPYTHLKNIQLKDLIPETTQYRVV